MQLNATQGQQAAVQTGPQVINVTLKVITFASDDSGRCYEDWRRKQESGLGAVGAGVIAAYGLYTNVLSGPSATPVPRGRGRWTRFRMQLG